MILNESRGTTGDLTCTICHTICIHTGLCIIYIYIYIYKIYTYLFKNDQH